MSTSLLYHAFGVRGYRYQRTEYDGGMVLFHIEPTEKMMCCSECGRRNVIRRGNKERWFRSVPIGAKLTWLVVNIPRVQCHDCQVVRQIKLGFAEPRRTVTKAGKVRHPAIMMLLRWTARVYPVFDNLRMPAVLPPVDASCRCRQFTLSH